MASWMAKSSFYRRLTTLLVVLALLQAARASQYTLWPYHQVYPPVNESDGRTPLYIAVTLSFGWPLASVAALPGVQIALDYINSQPDILPGYSLHYTLTDSQCNRATAVDAFFRQMLPGPTKVGWVGSGCSIATEPTAELTHFYNITQLSCVSASPTLSNRNRFRYYYQLLADGSLGSRGYTGIIRQYGWKKVAIITQNENLYIVMMDSLKEDLTEYDVEYTEKVFTSADGIAGLGPEPFDLEARIYVLAMYSYYVRPLICEAYKRGLRYPEQQFLIVDPSIEGWLIETNPTRDLGCTLEDRIKTVDRALTSLVKQFNTNASMETEGGLTGSQFQGQYWEKVNSSGNAHLNLKGIVKDGYFIYAEQCHEATMALALALHNTSQDLKENLTLNMAAAQEAGLPSGEDFTLANFSYVNSVVVETMSHYLKSPGFLGITGNVVQFTEDGTRDLDEILVYQKISGEGVGHLQPVGTVTGITQQDPVFQYSAGVTEREVWPDGIPTDGVPIEETVTLALPVSIVYIFLAIVGLLFGVTCLVFVFIFREKKLIRLSSPKLNCIIGIGAIVLYLNVIFLTTPATNPVLITVLCNLNPCLTALGYSLCYGTILMKMIRVWYIFNNPTLQKKIKFRDWHLSVAVLGLVITDVLILGVYLIVQGVTGQLTTTLVVSQEHPSEIIGLTAEVHVFLIHVCQSHGREALFAVLYGYKGLLQVTALILAFRTRKVKVKGLDDSKYVAAAIYVTSIVLAVTIISTYTLADYVNTYPAVVGAGFLLGTTMILVFVFVPKMVQLYKDPKGENVFAPVSGLSHQSTAKEEDLDAMRQKIKELETLLTISQRKKKGSVHADVKRNKEISKSISQPQFSDKRQAQPGPTHLVEDPAPKTE